MRVLEIPNIKYTVIVNFCQTKNANKSPPIDILLSVVLSCKENRGETRMARRRKRITKKELKEDKFVEAATEFAGFFRRHSAKLIWAVVGLFIVILSTRYGLQTRARARDEAALALTAANSFFFGGDYEEAISRYEGIIDRYPSTPSGVKCLYFLGNVYYLVGNYELALDHYERYLGKSKDPIAGPAALDGIGSCYEQMADYGEAARRYEEVFRRYPKSIIAAEALLSSGRCYESERDYESAKAAYERVIESFPETGKAQEAQSRFAFLKGREAVTRQTGLVQ